MSREIETSSKDADEYEKIIESHESECDSLRKNIEMQDNELKQLKEKAKNSFESMSETTSSIDYQKKLIYNITRLTWDEAALKKKQIKGFVVHPKGNDVSVFNFNSDAVGDAAYLSNFLWNDYIG